MKQNLMLRDNEYTHDRGCRPNSNKSNPHTRCQADAFSSQHIQGGWDAISVDELYTHAVTLKESAEPSLFYSKLRAAQTFWLRYEYVTTSVFHVMPFEQSS